MTWVKIVPPPPPPHCCATPGRASRTEANAGIGSTWLCEECTQMWEFTGGVPNAWEWASVAAMRRAFT